MSLKEAHFIACRKEGKTDEQIEDDWNSIEQDLQEQEVDEVEVRSEFVCQQCGEVRETSDRFHQTKQGLCGPIKEMRRERY